MFNKHFNNVPAFKQSGKILKKNSDYTLKSDDILMY